MKINENKGKWARVLNGGLWGVGVGVAVMVVVVDKLWVQSLRDSDLYVRRPTAIKRCLALL